METERTQAGDVVIVGAADTPTARKAVDRAGQIAAALGAKLYVVTAYGVDDVETVQVGTDRFIISTADAAEEFAANEARRLRAAFGLDAETVVSAGKPEDALIDAAERYDATLIVVGNVRMQGPSRLLGSVGNDVTHHAPCDVLVVKTT